MKKLLRRAARVVSLAGRASVLLGVGCSSSSGSGSPEVPSFAGTPDAPPAGGGVTPASGANGEPAPSASPGVEEAPMADLPLDEGNEPAASGGDDATSEPAGTDREPTAPPSMDAPAGDEPAVDEPTSEPPVTEPPATEPPTNEPPVVAPTLQRVLVFSRTTGFRHDSIGVGVQLVSTLGQQNGFAVDATEDPAQFSDQNLARYDVVVFMSTTGDVLNTAQEQSFERFIRAGGGWVGVHSASDTEYGWGFYGQLLGGNAYFLVHPEIQTAQVDVEIASHPSTAHLPARFPFQDELYNFRQNPRASVSVLMTLDESSYAPRDGAMGDHPIAWFHEFEGGRAWYTALGHRIELYSDPLFTRHVLGGIRWAAGVAN